MDSENLPVPNDQGQDLTFGDDAVSDVDLLASKLRGDLTDINAFVEGLAVRLEEMLPGLVRVERRKQGFRGPKLVTRIQLSGGSEALELRRDNAGLQTLRARTSGGITLRTEPLDIDTWLDAIAKLVADAAAKSERARQALQRLLLGS